MCDYFRKSKAQIYIHLLKFVCKKCFTYFSGDLLVNPDQPRLTIPISQIAPDLILADLPRNIMLNSDELEFEQAPEFLLGNYICWFEKKN